MEFAVPKQNQPYKKSDQIRSLKLFDLKIWKLSHQIISKQDNEHSMAAFALYVALFELMLLTNLGHN